MVISKTSNEDLDMKPITSPCLDCAARHAYCHGSCDLYAEYRRALDYHNKLLQEERDHERRLDDYEIERVRKARK